MPFEISDIALFLVSFAACLYCALLSRRLKALQNTKNGLGATIRAMSDSVAAVSSARHETQAQAGDLANRLTATMKEAQETAEKLKELKTAMEVKDRELSRRIQAADADIRSTLRETLEASSGKITEITRLTKRLEAIADRTSARFDSADYLFDEEQMSKSKRVYEG